jgi:hypothetical protein
MNHFRSESRPSVFCVAAGLLLTATAPAPAQVSVQIGMNFHASTYEVNSQALPADPNGAIGPNHFMEFINGTVAVYNRTNGQSVQRKTNLKFWSDAGLIISPDADVSDPRVIYDPTVQRWFASQVDFDAAAAASGQDPTFEANDFLLAVSASADPTGLWHGFMFQADPDNGTFADFPTLGLDADAVYLSGDMFFGEDNPLGPGLVSIPKADLLLSAPVITNRSWFGVMNPGERGQVLQPAICFDGTCAGMVLAMGDIGFDSDPHSNLVMFAVQNAALPGATLSPATSLAVSPYVVPFSDIMGVPLFGAAQPDGTATLQANDARLSAKVYAVGGVLHAVHSTDVNGRVGIRWYRIRAADAVVLESGTIADPALDLYYPSIAANADGAMVIAYNASGLSMFVSSYAVAGATVAGVTSFSSPLLLKAGSVSYHDLNEILAELLGDPPVFSRWGDYSSLSVDPSDPSRFWVIQMCASDVGSFEEGIWSTQITELVVAAPAQLSITRSNSFGLVSWPATAGAYHLESNSNLAAAGNWAPIAATNFSTNNGRIYFQTPLTNGPTFFRLHQP